MKTMTKAEVLAWFDSINGNQAIPVVRLIRAAVSELYEALKKANSSTEHFEREWYLRGDEIEELRAEVERLKRAVERKDATLTGIGEASSNFGMHDAAKLCSDAIAYTGDPT